MQTDSGVGLIDYLNVFADYKIRSKQVDVERRDEDRNMPDMVDVKSGNFRNDGLAGGSTSVNMGKIPAWAIGLGIVAVLALGVAVARRK